MQMLSEDDLNLRDLNPEELDAAWDLWFDLAQTTNDSDPLYSHGVFVNTRADPADEERPPAIPTGRGASHPSDDIGDDSSPRQA